MTTNFAQPVIVVDPQGALAQFAQPVIIYGPNNEPISVGKSAAQSMANAQGIKTQNFDRQLSAAATIQVSGTLYIMCVPVYRGETYSKVHLCVTAGAAGAFTFSKCGIWLPDNELISESADLAQAWDTVGMQVHDIAAFVNASYDAVYVGFAGVGTASTFSRSVAGGATAASANKIGAGMHPFACQTGITDALPTTLVPIVANSLSVWIGLS